MNPRWPQLLGPPPGTARLRSAPEDFAVEEIPAYEPCGQGEHLLVQIEKTGLSTDQALQALARHLRIRTGEFGTAGLKDRVAVTRQWISLPGRCRQALETFDHPQLRLLRAGLHTNKLKTGHLRGNRFQIRLRDIQADRTEVERRAQALLRLGFPNYFGPQRFGADGANEAEGRAVLQGRGRRHDKRGLRFMLNAVQSGLFNDVLAQRLRAELFSTVVAGDVLIKADSGGRFLCSQPELDQPRADRFEVHPSGPMFGPKMMAAEGLAGDMEQRVLADSGLSEQDWRRFAKLTSGARRPLRVALAEWDLQWQADDLVLRFRLPAGTYATSLIGELVEVETERSTRDGQGA